MSTQTPEEIIGSVIKACYDVKQTKPGVIKVVDAAIGSINALRRADKATADIKTLETIAALLNGDANQVEVTKNYIRNKLQMYKDKEDKEDKEEEHRNV